MRRLIKVVSKTRYFLPTLLVMFYILLALSIYLKHY